MPISAALIEAAPGTKSNHFNMTLEKLIESKLRREGIDSAIEYKKLVFSMSANYHESCKEILLDDMSSNRSIQILAKKKSRITVLSI